MTAMFVVERSPVYLQGQSPVLRLGVAPVGPPQNPGGVPCPYRARRRRRKRALASALHVLGSVSTRSSKAPVLGGGGTL